MSCEQDNARRLNQVRSAQRAYRERKELEDRMLAEKLERLKAIAASGPNPVAGVTLEALRMKVLELEGQGAGFHNVATEVKHETSVDTCSNCATEAQNLNRLENTVKLLEAKERELEQLQHDSFFR
ncbi:hypothetical protein HDU80_008101 [Chytriomyces hyalinus]|nr:hypothetical protein HDU80_008101 [Chytriomyces hyalinus]